MPDDTYPNVESSKRPAAPKTTKTPCLVTLNFDLSFSDLHIDPIENPDRITHFHHVVLTMSLLMQGIADIELVQKFFFPFRRQRRLHDVVDRFVHRIRTGRAALRLLGPVGS